MKKTVKILKKMKNQIVKTKSNNSNMRKIMKILKKIKNQIMSTLKNIYLSHHV